MKETEKKEKKEKQIIKQKRKKSKAKEMVRYKQQEKLSRKERKRMEREKQYEDLLHGACFDRHDAGEMMRRRAWTQGTHVHIASWNILAQSACTSQALDLDGESRMAAIKAQCASMNADILCLQEVEKDFFQQDLLAFMNNLGYEGVREERQKKKAGEVLKEIPSCAIFFKRKYFELAFVEVPFRSLICGLRFLTGPAQDQILAVTASHLEGAPWKGEARASQMKSALRKLQRHAPNFAVICGDLNDGPNSALCKLQLPEAGFSSAYDGHALDATYISPFQNSATRDETSRVDHVFHSKNLTPCAVQNVIDSTWDKGQLFSTGLPSPEWPSDHLSVAVVFKLHSQPTAHSAEENQLETLQALQEEVNQVVGEELLQEWKELQEEPEQDIDCPCQAKRKRCSMCRCLKANKDKMLHAFLQSLSPEQQPVMKQWVRALRKLSKHQETPNPPKKEFDDG